MKPIISFKNVVKKYNNQEVLSSLSFQIGKGDVVGLLGQSGIGKTTILKLVGGLEATTKGKVRIDAEQIGYVFQEPRLFPWKTALENVMLPLKAQGDNKQKAMDKAMHCLSLMELTQFMDYYPSQLSGGMKQRVSLARAFAIEPDVLLLDEPFSALDMKLRLSLLALINRQLSLQPMTVLYVSHSPGEVASIANKVFMMHSGHELTQISVSQCKNIEAEFKGNNACTSIKFKSEEKQCFFSTC